MVSYHSISPNNIQKVYFSLIPVISNQIPPPPPPQPSASFRQGKLYHRDPRYEKEILVGVVS